MNRKKVALGLSGGVDSSVACALLIEQGYDVTGVYLECYNEPGCRTDQDKKDALKVALQLGVKFEVLDFRRQYKAKVVEYFYHEYEIGRTPNPDVMCNLEIKFGMFYEWALGNGFDYVATGHYCQKTKVGPLFLKRAKDESKDQSYFLWQIPRDHLEHVIFPLGDMRKSEVRAKAKELGLLTADKPDSMGICFIGEVDVNKLLKEKLGEKPGEVMMYDQTQKFRSSPISAQRSELKVIGKHRGIWFYTIGQRGGFEIDSKHQTPKMAPCYVIAKDRENNRVVVGERARAMKDVFEIEDTDYEIPKGSKLYARIRNLGELHKVESIKKGKVKIENKVFAPSPGQSCVFYDEKAVLVHGSIIV